MSCTILYVVTDLTSHMEADVYHVPVSPGFAKEPLNLLLVRNNEKGVDLAERLSLTGVHAEQTEHSSHQQIATARIGYIGDFGWSHREFSASRNIINDHDGSFWVLYT